MDVFTVSNLNITNSPTYAYIFIYVYTNNNTHMITLCWPCAFRFVLTTATVTIDSENSIQRLTLPVDDLRTSTYRRAVNRYLGTYLH